MKEKKNWLMKWYSCNGKKLFKRDAWQKLAVGEIKVRGSYICVCVCFCCSSCNCRYVDSSHWQQRMMSVLNEESLDVCFATLGAVSIFANKPAGNTLITNRHIHTLKNDNRKGTRIQYTCRQTETKTTQEAPKCELHI